jgi:hypothetical protein
MRRDEIRRGGMREEHACCAPCGLSCWPLHRRHTLPAACERSAAGRWMWRALEHGEKWRGGQREREIFCLVPWLWGQLAHFSRCHEDA